MTRIDPAGMAEATRLTRAGRLDEATRLIQSLLGRAPAAPSGEPDWAGPTLDLVPERQGDPHDLRQAAGGHQHDLRHADGGGQHDLRHAPDGRQHDWRQARNRHRRDRRQPATGRQHDLRHADGGLWVDGVHANPFGERPYKLFVPHRLPPTPVPLVVMLHGCTQGPDDFARGTAMNRLAAEEGCIVVYPGQVASANAQRCWNWFQPTDQERERGEPSLIAGITRRVIADHPVDPARVYVAGMSAGGAKAVIMAVTYPELFAAAGVHSGLAHGAARDVASAFAAMRQPGSGPATRPAGRWVPAIVVHGDDDRVVHPGNAELIVRQLLGGSDVRHVRVHEDRVPGGHGYRRIRHLMAGGRVAVEHWQVQGLGHAWSGGDPTGSYTDPRGPDASRAMLDFFLGQRQPPSG